MKPIHEELKELRLEKNISLEQMYDATKIRISILEQMEQGDFSMVPQPFIRAFLKEYGSVIGIDPERVILRYEKKIDYIRKPEPPAPKPETIETAQSPEPEESKPKADPKPSSSKDGKKQKSADAGDKEPVREETEDSSKKPDKSEQAPTAGEQVISTETDTQPSLFSNVQTEQQAVPEPEKSMEASHTGTPPLNLDTVKTDESKSTPSIRQHLEIDEPSATRNVVFIVFFIIIIIAALVIFWINRGY